MPPRASGTQQQQAKLVLAWEWGKGAGGELWWWWRGYNNRQTRLIISCDPYTSRNTYWAMLRAAPQSPKPLMFGLVPPCPRALGTASRCGWLVSLPHLRLVTFTLNQWLPTGIHRHPHRPQHLHGVLSTLPSHCSILAHVSGQWLAVLFSVCPRWGGYIFQPFSYTVVGLWLPCFRLQPTPMETLGGKRWLPTSCPFLSHKAKALKSQGPTE